MMTYGQESDSLSHTEKIFRWSITLVTYSATKCFIPQLNRKVDNNTSSIQNKKSIFFCHLKTISDSFFLSCESSSILLKYMDNSFS